MKIIENTIEFYIEEETAVAIGKFDGFHRGHQKLLERLSAQKSKGRKSVVFTFVPSPAAFFSGEIVRELSTVAEKRQIFEKAGVDYLIEYPFSKEIADMEPEVYIEKVLVNRLNAKCIVAGDDVSYGRHGAGDCRLLQEKAVAYGYEVQIIDKVLYQGREVSSTYVREEVKNGNMELVAELLGAPYHIGGKIIHGRQLGRTLGMPTVNLLPDKEKLLPPKGVYYSYVRLYDNCNCNRNRNDVFQTAKALPAITNIGTKPTVDNRSVMGVETYIYDFNADVYGAQMEVALLHYKRPEMHFDNIESLKAQMRVDLADGKVYHGIG